MSIVRGTQMQDFPADTKKRGPSSRVLEEVIRQAPSEYVTVGWLTSPLHRDSFGIVMLCLPHARQAEVASRCGHECVKIGGGVVVVALNGLLSPAQFVPEG